MCGDLRRGVSYAERAAHLFKSLGCGARLLSSSLHILVMCCESQDLDKAEVMALRVAGDSAAAAQDTRERVVGMLATIRAAMEHGLRLDVRRGSGWPVEVRLVK